LGQANWWPIPFPKDQVAASVNRKEVFVVEKEDEIVATFSLIWSDPKFWGSQPSPAGYLHKLAVSRAFAHQGIGEKILVWAEDYVSQSGRSFLRLDCQASNPFIVAYYQAHGFRKVRIVNIPLDGENLLFQLMEKKVGNE
jgi:ribosomal protein S18 acetylase RimI-like enzyme